MSDATLGVETRPTGVRWSVFALACGTSWLLYFHRYTFALIKPELKQEWHLGSDDLGVLDSVFFTSYTACQIPLGIAGDVYGVRLVLTLLIVGWSAGLALQAAAPTRGWMAAALAVFGLGQSAAYACLSSVSRSWFPASVRTSLQGWVGVFFGRFGGLSSNLLVGTVLMGMLGVDWRTLLYALAASGAAYAGWFWIVFRDRPRDHPRVNAAEVALLEGPAGDPPASSAARRDSLSVRQLLKGLRGRALFNLLALNVQTILSTAADILYSNWIPSFLADVYRFDSQERATMAALPLLGGALGGTLGGWLNDELIRATGDLRWGRRLVGMGGKCTAGLLLTAGAVLLFDRPYWFCGLLFVVKLFSDSGLATTWGTVTDIGGRASASVFAFNNAVAGIGSIVAPVLFGVIAEQYGWRPVFFTAAGFYVLCGLSWLAIDPRIPVAGDDAKG